MVDPDLLAALFINCWQGAMIRTKCDPAAPCDCLRLAVGGLKGANHGVVRKNEPSLCVKLLLRSSSVERRRSGGRHSTAVNNVVGAVDRGRAVRYEERYEFGDFFRLSRTADRYAADHVHDSLARGGFVYAAALGELHDHAMRPTSIERFETIHHSQIFGEGEIATGQFPLGAHAPTRRRTPA